MNLLRSVLVSALRVWFGRLYCLYLGYCGADLKALCTEAALHALRRRYPQIYASEDKLQLDVASIQVNAKDFVRSMQGLVPTAQRSALNPAHALSLSVRPLLSQMLQSCLDHVERIFPTALLSSPLQSQNG